MAMFHVESIVSTCSGIEDTKNPIPHSYIFILAKHTWPQHFKKRMINLMTTAGEDFTYLYNQTGEQSIDEDNDEDDEDDENKEDDDKDGDDDGDGDGEDDEEEENERQNSEHTDDNEEMSDSNDMSNGDDEDDD